MDKLGQLVNGTYTSGYSDGRGVSRLLRFHTTLARSLVLCILTLRASDSILSLSLLPLPVYVYECVCVFIYAVVFAYMIVCGVHYGTLAQGAIESQV